MQAIQALARKYQLRIIEDACEATGASWRGRHVGTIGDIGTFAFYPNKQMTTGEGGMLVTDDPSLDELVKSLRNQGRGTNGAWLQHERVGYNYRLSDIQCALGLSQLSRIETLLAKRAAVAAMYLEHLADVEEVELPPDELPEARVSWFVYVVRLRRAGRCRRDAVLEYLRAHGVACADYFSPIHLQPHFRARGHGPGDFPVTERVAESTLALPFFNNLTEEEVRHVARTLKDALYELRESTAHSLHRPVL
jgi:perosamine synthetase